MYVISLILIAVLVAADQLIKLAVVKNIEIGEIIRVIHFGSHDIFDLTHINNKGAAWSIMEGKTWFLVGFPLVIIIGGLVYMYLKRRDSKIQNIALALLVAGGIGNLIDRIAYKEVVDYIKFVPINFPVFNFADICVVVGVILLAVYFIFLDNTGKKTKDTPENAADAETVKESDDTGMTAVSVSDDPEISDE